MNVYTSDININALKFAIDMNSYLINIWLFTTILQPSLNLKKIKVDKSMTNSGLSGPK